MDHYYVFFRIFNLDFTSTFPDMLKKLVSWNEASDACQSIGGSLPIIRSREELDELIALVKLSSFFPPSDFIFVNLTSVDTSGAVTITEK